MERELLGGEDKNWSKCQVCINIIDKNKSKYVVCPQSHVVCFGCLKAQISQDVCPICLTPFAKDQQLNAKIYELLNWNDVLDLSPQKIQSGEKEGQELQEYPKQIKKSSSDEERYSMGLSYSFGQFYQSNEQAFLGVKIDVRSYLALLAVQFVFTLFNFYFGLARMDKHICYQESYQRRTLAYQSWLVGVGILEVVFLSFSLLFVLFFRGKCISGDEFGKCWRIIKVIFGLKIILWSWIQIVIFVRGVPSYCIFGLHTFAMFNAIIHVLLLSFVFAELGDLRKKTLFIVLQFYLAFFNIYYGFKDIEDLIPDEQHWDIIGIYQWWLRAVGLFEWIFMMVIIILFRLQNLGVFKLGKFGKILMILYGIKIVCWLAMQLYTFLFKYEALMACTGGLLLYTVINAGLHVAFIVVIFLKKQ